MTTQLPTHAGRLGGKVSVVTGASHGIGRALAIALAREGSDVVLVARDQDSLEETAMRVRNEGRMAWVLVTDIRDVNQVRSMAERIADQLSKIDILFNGASASSDPTEKLDVLDFEKIAEICDTTLRGTILVTKALLPLLKASGNSNVFTMSSDWGLSGSQGGPSVFSAAKAGVRAFSLALKREVLQWGIKPTVIAAGDVASFDADWEEPKWDIDDAVEDIRKELGTTRIALRRVVNCVINVAIEYDMIVYDEIHVSPLDEEYRF